MRQFILLAMLVICASARHEYVNTAGVKGRYSGRGYQYHAGENVESRCNPPNVCVTQQQSHDSANQQHPTQPGTQPNYPGYSGNQQPNNPDNQFNLNDAESLQSNRPIINSGTMLIFDNLSVVVFNNTGAIRAINNINPLDSNHLTNHGPIINSGTMKIFLKLTVLTTDDPINNSPPSLTIRTDHQPTSTANLLSNQIINSGTIKTFQNLTLLITNKRNIQAINNKTPQVTTKLTNLVPGLTTRTVYQATSSVNLLNRQIINTGTIMIVDNLRVLAINNPNIKLTELAPKNPIPQAINDAIITLINNLLIPGIDNPTILEITN